MQLCYKCTFFHKRIYVLSSCVLILAVKRMRSYKYNCVHATSFACSTGTSTLSYDRPAQCYCRMLSIDDSRGHCRWWYIHLSGGMQPQGSWPICSAVYSLKFPMCLKSSISSFFNFPLAVSSNGGLSTYKKCWNSIFNKQWFLSCEEEVSDYFTPAHAYGVIKASVL